MKSVAKIISGGPGRTRTSQLNQSLAEKWDTKSFHGIIMFLIQVSHLKFLIKRCEHDKIFEPLFTVLRCSISNDIKFAGPSVFAELARFEIISKASPLESLSHAADGAADAPDGPKSTWSVKPASQGPQNPTEPHGCRCRPK
jgi:hypothetical protein